MYCIKCGAANTAAMCSNCGFSVTCGSFLSLFPVINKPLINKQTPCEPDSCSVDEARARLVSVFQAVKDSAGAKPYPEIKAQLDETKKESIARLCLSLQAVVKKQYSTLSSVPIAELIALNRKNTLPPENGELRAVSCDESVKSDTLYKPCHAKYINPHESDKNGMEAIKFSLPNYIGEVSNGKKEGQGFLFYPNRNLMYCGGFKNDKRSGYGIAYDEYGYIVYAGTWQEDLRTGAQLREFNCVDEYIGETLDNKMEGFGVHNYCGFAAYIGLWHNGKYSGPGRLTDYRTSYSDGWFENGLKNGVFSVTYYDTRKTRQILYKNGDAVE